MNIISCKTFGQRKQYHRTRSRCEKGEPLKEFMMALILYQNITREYTTIDEMSNCSELLIMSHELHHTLDHNIPKANYNTQFCHRDYEGGCSKVQKVSKKPFFHQFLGNSHIIVYFCWKCQLWNYLVEMRHAVRYFSKTKLENR